jgi:hypothetical protein
MTALPTHGNFEAQISAEDSTCLLGRRAGIIAPGVALGMAELCPTSRSGGEQ